MEDVFAIEPDLIDGFPNLAIDDSRNIYTTLGSRHIITKLGPLVPYLNVESKKISFMQIPTDMGILSMRLGVILKPLNLRPVQPCTPLNIKLNPSLSRLSLMPFPMKLL